MKKTSLILMLALTVLACQDEEVTPPLPFACDSILTVDADFYQNAPTDDLFILSASIEDHCLDVEFSATGCDGISWEIQLLDANVILESLPVQRNIRLSLSNLELCDFIPTRNISFDLSSAQIVEYNEIYFNLQGWEEALLYSY